MSIIPNCLFGTESKNYKESPILKFYKIIIIQYKNKLSIIYKYI